MVSPASRNPFLGAGDAITVPDPKNNFLYYSKNLFKFFNIVEQIKNWNFYTMVVIYRYRKNIPKIFHRI